MDIFGGFLDEGCVPEPGAVVTAKELYASYQRWCEANGEKARSQKALAMGLRERGYEGFKGSKGVRCWRGLRLRREGEAAEAGGGWRVGGASPGYSKDLPQGAHGAQGGCEGSAQRVKYPENAPPPATRHPEAPDTPADPGWEEGEL